VKAARAHLELDARRPVQAKFRASRTRTGYKVFVEFFSGYDEQGKPAGFFCGGHCVIFFSKSWDVVKVIGGA
jgi:hypothetical protein